MGIFDSFTGAPAKKAAQQQRTFFDQTQNQGNTNIDTGYNTATGAVRAGTAGAQGALQGGYNDALGFANQGAGGAIGYIDQGANNAFGRLDQTAATARGDYAPLSALGQKYGGATTLALGALGANGAEGQAAARDAFTSGPAYEFNLNSGIEAINRARNARGMANSGNTDQDAQKFGAGLASNEYNTWMNNLLGFTNPELSATSGAASGMANASLSTGLAGANIANSSGIAKAGIEGNRGAMLADLSKWYGGQGAGLEAGQGNTLANLATGAAGQKVGLAQNLAQPYAQTYGQEAAAAQQGNKNMWDFGINLAALGTGQYGKKQGASAAPDLWNTGQTFLQQMA